MTDSKQLIDNLILEAISRMNLQKMLYLLRISSRDPFGGETFGGETFFSNEEFWWSQ